MERQRRVGNVISTVRFLIGARALCAMSEGGDLVYDSKDDRTIFEGLEVCRNMLEAAMQLRDPVLSRSMYDITWELLLSVQRFRRRAGLSREAEPRFIEKAIEVQVGLDRCRQAFERRA